MTDIDRYADPPSLPEGDRVDLPAFLPGEGPLEIEIGPGRGAFLIERCHTEPSVRIIGLEIRRKWACLVDERLARLGFGDRARALCEDARIALPRVGPDGCVARVFVHFPDPWWKKRHQKRMVIAPELIIQVARLLEDGGELLIQTDVPDRAEAYERIVGGCEALVPAGDSEGDPRLSHNPYGARGNRERRADEDGLPVSRLRWRRRPRS